MKRAVGRIVLIATTAVCTLVALAAVASADPGQFLGDLGTLGHAQNTPAQRDSAVQRGYTVCRELGAGVSKPDMMGRLMAEEPSWSSQEAADWIAASVYGLCPQYK